MNAFIICEATTKHNKAGTIWICLDLYLLFAFIICWMLVQHRNGLVSGHLVCWRVGVSDGRIRNLISPKENNLFPVDSKSLHSARYNQNETTNIYITRVKGVPILAFLSSDHSGQSSSFHIRWNWSFVIDVPKRTESARISCNYRFRAFPLQLWPFKWVLDMFKTHRGLNKMATILQMLF